MSLSKTFTYNKANWSELYSLVTHSNIKHYSFDFWNTIAFSNPRFKKERSKYIYKILKHSIEKEHINMVFAQIGVEYNNLMENQSIILSPETLYYKVFQQLNYQEEVNIEKILGEIENLFLKYPPIIASEFLTFLKFINEENKTISITSNTAFVPGFVIQKFLGSIGLLDNFKFCLFSDSEGLAKPNKSIFNNVFINAKSIQPNLNLDEILHVGDSLNADYNGAKNAGLEAFNLIFNSPSPPFKERFALHSITNKNKVPFSSNEYSRFKFGDYSIAKEYGGQLFDFFKNKYLPEILESKKTIVIYSSPYFSIPTSSFYLTYEFYKLLEKHLNSVIGNKIKLKFGKIKRCQTYIEDYGEMNAEERFDLIKNDTYEFVDIPTRNDLCIYIDDISITGTHQRVIEDLLFKHCIKSENIFLYYAKLDNDTVYPSFENELNFSFVNSIQNLCEVVCSPQYKITTRTTKHILRLNKSDLNYLIERLISSDKMGIIKELYKASLENYYNLIDEYKTNLSLLKTSLEIRGVFIETHANCI